MFSTYRVQYQLRTHRRDPLIELIKHLLSSPFAIISRSDKAAREEQYRSVFLALEQLVRDHISDPGNQSSRNSKLRELVPSIGTFFTPLPLVDAFKIYDQRTSLSSRQFIPPSFNDIRFILNLSQLQAIAPTLQLVSFDGDATLYPDGHFLENERLVAHLIALMRRGVFVALVTAAGYANDPEKYEKRLGLLFERLSSNHMSPEHLRRLFVMGGECNFLYQCDANCKLASIEFDSFATDEMRQWSTQESQNMLDVAEASLKSSIARLDLDLQVVRKSRGVGTVKSNRSGKALRREQLDELTLSAKHDVQDACKDIPFCAFNGGSDVWIDVGNKHYGVQAIQQFLNCEPARTLHVGDQFLSTGNDIAARQACSTVWIATPEETADALDDLEDFLQKTRES